MAPLQVTELQKKQMGWGHEVNQRKSSFNFFNVPVKTLKLVKYRINPFLHGSINVNIILYLQWIVFLDILSFTFENVLFTQTFVVVGTLRLSWLRHHLLAEHITNIYAQVKVMYSFIWKSVMDDISSFNVRDDNLSSKQGSLCTFKIMQNNKDYSIKFLNIYLHIFIFRMPWISQFQNSF